MGFVPHYQDRQERGIQGGVMDHVDAKISSIRDRKIEGATLSLNSTKLYQKPTFLAKMELGIAFMFKTITFQYFTWIFGKGDCVHPVTEMRDCAIGLLTSLQKRLIDGPTASTNATRMRGIEAS